MTSAHCCRVQMYSPQPPGQFAQEGIRAPGHKTYVLQLCSPPPALEELEKESKYVIADVLVEAILPARFWPGLPVWPPIPRSIATAPVIETLPAIISSDPFNECARR
jgi:hypothetical protein